MSGLVNLLLAIQQQAAAVIVSCRNRTSLARRRWKKLKKDYLEVPEEAKCRKCRQQVDCYRSKGRQHLHVFSLQPSWHLDNPQERKSRCVGCLSQNAVDNTSQVCVPKRQRYVKAPYFLARIVEQIRRPGRTCLFRHRPSFSALRWSDHRRTSAEDQIYQYDCFIQEKCLIRMIQAFKKLVMEGNTNSSGELPS